MDHSGKKALITGGTRGIGKAIAMRLAEEGCDLVLNFLANDDAAEETVQAIQEKGVKASLLKANLAENDQIQELAAEALKILGSVDYVIHCAALGNFKTISKLRSNQWDLTMNINTRSFLVLAQALSPKMKEGSSFIALSSSGANSVVPNYGAIGISKAALECLVRYLAVELIEKGIRVNAVSAGLVQTQSANAFPEAERMQQEIIARTPAKRLGQPQDLAGVVSFLLSPDANWIVGQTLLADGGLSLV
jgi:enoyl-[acyl-carrier protein] reductase III